jgi:predicted permease
VGAWLQDLRYCFRSLRKSPGLTCVVILTLGLGIGFNTAIYSVVNAFLLRPLPVKDPGQLVVLAARDKHTEVPHGMSFADYRDYLGLTGVFSDMLARREFAFATNWKRDERTERIWVDAVTPNYFQVLGVSAVLGRIFQPDETRQPIAVLDHTCWRDKFAADPGIVGRTINLDGHLVTVIGVAPEGFQGTQVAMRPDIYVPLEAPGLTGLTAERFEQRDAHELRLMARLKSGVSIAQARAAVNQLAARLSAQYSDTNKGVAVITIPERFARPEPQVSEALPTISVASMAIVGLVLLIACANIANLLLVRATARRKEMALRTAVGASRLSIVRLLLTESLVLGLLGGAMGVWLAYGVVRLMRLRPPSVDLPVHMDWSPDGRVLLFAAFVALLTGTLCGLAPALEVSRPDLATVLKESAGRATGSKRRLTSLFVGGQVGVSMLLLILAGLFIRGARKAQEVDLGFNRNNLQLLSVDLAKQNYDQTHGREFIRRLLEEIQAMPGVRGASVAKWIPFEQQGNEAVFSEDQVAARRSDALSVLSNTVGEEYFRVMEIPVLHGRGFDRHDDGTAPRVAIINEALASRLWPEQDPLRRRIRLAGGDVVQVIGVVKTGKYAFLNEPARPYLYLPFRQNYGSPAIFHIRTAGTPKLLLPAVRQAIRALDPDLPVYSVKTMREHLENGYVFSGIILGGTMSGLFGVLGLTLASIGLYGVVANTVSQRTREIGIRTALGASGARILRLMVKESMLLVAAGIAAGFAGGVGAARFLKRVLFSVDPADWRTIAVLMGALAMVAALACLVPARRAAKVDPLVALRWE